MSTLEQTEKQLAEKARAYVRRFDGAERKRMTSFLRELIDAVDQYDALRRDKAA
jgi:hypothetical protein